MLISILLATLAISFLSLIGVLTLVVSKTSLDRLLLFLIALAAGGLMGGAFLHLIPESIELAEEMTGNSHAALEQVFLFLIGGFCLFLFLEQGLHWHHQHGRVHEGHTCDKKPLSYLILFGDGVHNLIDGLVIAASFLVSPLTGWITTVAVALHEIPQEMGDFGVLVYGGFKRSRALFFNLLSGLTAVLGGVIGYFFAGRSEAFMLYLLPVAAGGFLYLAASDLIPEIKHEHQEGKKVFAYFLTFLLGIAIVWMMRFLPIEH
ncbi:TPA: ZIP family metal transporter [Candidatus Uhrbacteria bacterium]|uniref:Zinc/iron permease n=2 Tax=Candidatus Uhriibacteriota TaxID=1752732 RepID=A0A0G1SH19_9BACT|nr:MAG: Zinc/iron permease [Candidatus Uhrbacteria bacterium GW2011_GWF2_46_218]KKU41403.1 MAG: Zinc/iron permease [Candidatus Uhrbacteria bacterium GW2011_GWE2_46_68]HBK33840.1 ZIP family metal transporter [Candidatus Uhrbacteria bacterium]HCB19320.1 ZIP family metal transporter [Candidatus Uhrbacteria bacterium]